MSSNSAASPKQLGPLLRQKDRDIALLQRVAEIISSVWQLDEILSQVVDLVTGVTKADGCFLYVYEPGTSELILRASKNPHPMELGQIRLKLGEGITGWVASHKKPVVIFKNASEDARFRVFRNLPEDRYEAFLSIPVLTKDEVVGVINVQHKKGRRHRPHEIGILSTIGRLIGGAIEKARLYEESRIMGERIQTLEEDLQTRKVVDRAKGVLMALEGLTEEEAFKRIQSQSMSLRKTMKEVAQAILIAKDVAAKSLRGK
ncbi:MAG: GAF and ANTAR domain-containing protein [Elusimicrobia bacterium]|nr:GAF and ANTAR domain-containing protein [Elusimicrobiota bacterium]